MPTPRIKVGIAEMAVAQGDVILEAVGLGSCVAVAIYDPSTKTGGMVHPLLPSFNGYHPGSLPLKFMDKALKELIDKLIARGCKKEHLIAKAAGGASIFIMHHTPNIGAENAKMAQKILEKEGIPLVSADFGGRVGRTVEFHLSDGKMIVRTVKGTISTI